MSDVVLIVMNIEKQLLESRRFQFAPLGQ